MPRIILFFLFLPVYGFATTIDTIPEPDTLENIKSNFTILDVGFGFGNQSSLSENKNYQLNFSASYFHHSGFSVGGFFQQNTDSLKTRFFDIQVGYEYNAETWDIGVNYSRHFSQGDTSLEMFAYKNLISLSGGKSLGDFYAFASVELYADTKQYTFMSLNATYFFSIDSIFSSSFGLSFTPLVSFNFGTDSWFFEQFTDRQMRWVDRYLEQNYYSPKGFGFNSTDFMLPVSLSWRDFELSLSAYYTNPSTRMQILKFEPKWSWAISMSYIF